MIVVGSRYGLKAGNRSAFNRPLSIRMLHSIPTYLVSELELNLEVHFNHKDEQKLTTQQFFSNSPMG